MLLVCFFIISSIDGVVVRISTVRLSEMEKKTVYIHTCTKAWEPLKSSGVMRQRLKIQVLMTTRFSLEHC